MTNLFNVNVVIFMSLCTIILVLWLFPGCYFGSYFIMGGERFDTNQQDTYLFGENEDLNFLGSKPVPVSQLSNLTLDVWQPIEYFFHYYILLRHAFKIQKSSPNSCIKGELIYKTKTGMIFPWYQDECSAWNLSVWFWSLSTGTSAVRSSI